MILIKPNHDRFLEIPGVPRPVLRPVDIDQSMTGFSSLRTLRIYRFDKESVIEGHAEEDEVFIVVLTGSVELTMIVDTVENAPVTLAAPNGAEGGVACAAYLPPHAAYKLTPRSDADVAYARATPSSGRSPKSFSSLVRADSTRPNLVLEETAYAERLRFRLMLFRAQESDASFMPVNESEAMCEALVYVRSVPRTGVSITGSRYATQACLDSWDTAVVGPGEDLTLTIAGGLAALVLVVMAC